jgi:SPP1 gp7 family putative phage head morphogenesis protein
MEPLGKTFHEVFPKRAALFDKVFSRGFTKDVSEAVRRLGRPTGNAYCPTGPGGGQDNSCSSSKGGSTREQQVNSPEFKRWFGDSKVVDAAGKPLVVYHGTSATFDEFNVGEGGSYFSPDAELASDYALKNPGRIGSHVKAVYLSIKNPASREDALSARDAAVASGRSVKGELLRRGFDGLVYDHSGTNRVYVAFQATQIKSASGNRGTFDPTDPIITHARSKQPRKRKPNPLRTDPSRTAQLRRQFRSALRARVRLLKRDLLKLLVEEDAFGLVQREPLELNVYCPNGPGGGIDPTCSPSHSGSGLDLDNPETWPKYDVSQRSTHDLYHVTLADNLISLQKSGFIAKAASSMGEPVDTDRIFFATSKEQALSIVSQLEQVAESPVALIQVRVPAKLLEKLDPRIDMGMPESAIAVKPSSKLTKDFFLSVRVSKAGEHLVPSSWQERVVNAGRWAFGTSDEKLRLFKLWLKRKLAQYLTKEEIGKTEQQWWERYIRDSYMKGAGRMWTDTKHKAAKWGPGEGQFYRGTKEDFLRSSFGRPVAVAKVKLLAERTYTDIVGVTEQLGTKLSRALADGLIQGKNPRAIADESLDFLDAYENQAETVARTEIIRSHAEGQLDALEEMGIDEVGVMVEWSTAGDGRVCELCEPLEGVVLKIEEARGLIPRHPNCRCAHIPANVGEDRDEQTRGKQGIDAAIEESVELEGGDNKTKWAGADRDISQERPEALVNVFCPTGPGGGVDPTCSPGGASGAGRADSTGRTGGAEAARLDLPNPSTVKVIKSLPGSTGPKLVEDGVGKQWVMKTADSASGVARLRNEATADEVYRVLGIATPESGVVGNAKFSEYHDQSQTLADWEQTASGPMKEAMRVKIRAGFVADALLANWDVVGLSKDNIMVVYGKPVRVDNGGALKYRAQGSLKGSKFTNHVGELDTMRDGHLNPSAASVFKGITDKEIATQIKHIVDNKEKILAAVSDKETRDILKLRIEDLKMKHGSYAGSGKQQEPTAPKPTSPAATKPTSPTTTKPSASEGGQPVATVGKGPPVAWHSPVESGMQLSDYIKAKGEAKYSAKMLGKVLPDDYLAKLVVLNPEGLTSGTVRLPGVSKTRLRVLALMLPKGTKFLVGVKSADELTSVTKKAIAGSSFNGEITHNKDLGSFKESTSLSQAHKDWVHSLTSSELGAVSSWKGSAAGIRKSIVKATNEGTSPSTEAANFLKAISKTQPLKGTLYRGISSKDHADSIIKQCLATGIGGTWADAAPMGMSRSSHKAASSFAHGELLLRLIVKTARPIEPADGFGSEKEIIAMPGTKFIIRAIHHAAKFVDSTGHKHNKTVIDLEEV